MDNKNESGQSPLFYVACADMTFSQCLVLFAIIFGELFVMYIIQNVFKNENMHGVGIICLVISLFISGTGIIRYCRYLKREKNKK